MNPSSPKTGEPSAPSPPRFHWRARAESFRHAWRGVALLVRTQHNARLHLAATLLVALAGWAFGVSRTEWGLLTLAAALVWTAEALNTAVELLADEVRPEFRPLVGKAKDVGAGGVLLASAGAAVAGLLVFGPRVAGWLNGWKP